MDPEADIEISLCGRLTEGTTLAELKILSEEEYGRLIACRFQSTASMPPLRSKGRDFVLVHAGVKSNGVHSPTAWDKASLEQYLGKRLKTIAVDSRRVWQYPTDFIR